MLKCVGAAIVAVFAFSASPASAYIDAQCQMGIGVAVCQPRMTNPDAKIIVLDQVYHNPDVTDADRAEWQEACQPRKVWDGRTVRIEYLLPHCEVGPLPGNVHLH